MTPHQARRLLHSPAGVGHWNSPIVADGRIAVPEGSSNDHAVERHPRYLAPALERIQVQKPEIATGAKPIADPSASPPNHVPV